jgi:hypothetical protein
MQEGQQKRWEGFAWGYHGTTGRTLADLGSAGAGERREGAGGRNSKFENWNWPYFVPRWRDFLLRQGFGEHVEGFSLRSKIKQGLEGLGKGFRLRR